MSEKRKLFVGTSGWTYPYWKKTFYSETLLIKDKLKYYSSYFKTTEINYSFYRLPTSTIYQNWYSQTPADFLFAVKASRLITHIKRLKGVREYWKKFFKNALFLKEKLGPILFQFPPNFKASGENIKRLKIFLELITKTPNYKPNILRYAFEFRYKSWCDDRIYKLFKKYNIAWVIADSSRYPRINEITADFIYVRMHGSKMMFSSKYTGKELKKLVKKIKKWLKTYDVYVYFNNDAHGYAVENAKELIKLCE